MFNGFGWKVFAYLETTFSEVTMAFYRLFKTILLKNEHNGSLGSPITRNNSVRFVPRATVSQQCKKRRTSRAGYELCPSSDNIT